MRMIYHWSLSTLLQQYSCGDLMAVAESADEARDIIRAHFEPWARAEREWWFLVDDDHDEFEAARVKLEADLAVEPKVISVAFIWGSE